MVLLVPFLGFYYTFYGIVCLQTNGAIGYRRVDL